MIRIDIDRYKIVFVEYDDHLHRYAVPMQWTVGILAGHIIDTFDKEKPIRFRRQAKTKYHSYAHGARLNPHTAMDAFEEECLILVKVEG